MPVNPQQLHHEFRLARSKSVNHKQALRTRSRSRGGGESSGNTGSRQPLAPVAPLPDLPPPQQLEKHHAKGEKGEREEVRSPSPDIETIISSTPRRPPPLLRKQFSDLGPITTATTATRKSTSSSSSFRRRKSSNVSARTVSSSSSSGSYGSMALARGVLRDRVVVVDGSVVDGEQAERDDGFELGGDVGGGGEDSDSSLDLHTPLP